MTKTAVRPRMRKQVLELGMIKARITLIVLLVGIGSSAGAGFFSRPEKIFREGDHTWVKLAPGRKDLRPFDHPWNFSEAEMDRCLASIRYLRPELAWLTGRPGKEFDLLSVEERARIAPPLVKALAKAAPEEWVDFSISGWRGQGVIGSYRQSEGVMFVKDGELHVAFRKIALKKAPGEDNAVSDPTRSYSFKVRVAPGAGQRLMKTTSKSKEVQHLNWVVIKFAELEPGAGPAPTKVEPTEPSASGTRNASPAVSPSAPLESSPVPPTAPARDRLQELKQLYDEGLISSEEYQKKREQILEEL